MRKLLAATLLSLTMMSAHADDGIWDQIEGNWDQFKGQVKETWGDLTDDDTLELSGERDQLIGKIQERYGIAKEEAEEQVDSWAESLNLDS